jgi:NADPH-dependent glutamate synthase beta subunit-like oxidoreductase
VTLTSIFQIDKMQASKHEVEHALGEGIAIRGGMAPVAVLRGPDGRATGLRVMRCEAKIVGGKLDVKTMPGTEEDIEADLIVSAIGQAVDFTGPGGAEQRQGRDRQRQELPGARPASRHVRAAATWCARTC